MSSIIKVDTIQNQSGANIISESSNTITLGASGDTITVPSGATLNVNSSATLSGALTNTPAFIAYKTANQTIATATDAKITFEAEQLDTNSGYDTSLSRFTPGVAGYYWIGAYWRYATSTNFTNGQWLLYKNGAVLNNVTQSNDDNEANNYNYITYASATDYFEMYGYQNSGINVTVNGSASYQGSQVQSQFYAFKLIGV